MPFPWTKHSRTFMRTFPFRYEEIGNKHAISRFDFDFFIACWPLDLLDRDKWRPKQHGTCWNETDRQTNWNRIKYKNGILFYVCVSSTNDRNEILGIQSKQLLADWQSPWTLSLSRSLCHCLRVLLKFHSQSYHTIHTNFPSQFCAHSNEPYQRHAIQMHAKRHKMEERKQNNKYKI